MMMMMGNQNPNVFTAAQWEELEQQALIYKYMVSGVPVPTDLILSVRRSLYNISSSSSSLPNKTTSNLGVWDGGFPYNQLYQIGGRKIDLEPGRCRRTDGKKWRCSKEAYPDSKYCERHMHRGRNRSRKPVEFPTSSTSSSSSSTPTALHVSNSSPSTTISKSVSHSDPYPPFSSLHTNQLMASSSSYSHPTLKDYRNLQGMKDLGEGSDNQRSAYFQQHDHAYTTTTQKMSSGHHGYSSFSFQNLKDEQKKEEGQHCFVMGTDFIKPEQEQQEENTSITKVDENTTTKQSFHHFFSPPLNPNHDPNWLISPPKPPLSTQDLFQSKPRPYW